MKLADISKYRDVVEYANSHGYKTVQFEDRADELVNATNMVNKVLKMTRDSGCIEFCFGGIESKYNFHTDGHTWRVFVYGFKPIT